MAARPRMWTQVAKGDHRPEWPHRLSLCSTIMCPKQTPVCWHRLPMHRQESIPTPVTDASMPVRATQLHVRLSPQVWEHLVPQLPLRLLRGALTAVVCVTRPQRPCDSVVFLPLCQDVHGSKLIALALSRMTTLASKDPARLGSTSRGRGGALPPVCQLHVTWSLAEWHTRPPAARGRM